MSTRDNDEKAMLNKIVDELYESVQFKTGSFRKYFPLLDIGQEDDLVEYKYSGSQKTRWICCNVCDTYIISSPGEYRIAKKYLSKIVQHLYDHAMQITPEQHRSAKELFGDVTLCSPENRLLSAWDINGIRLRADRKLERIRRLSALKKLRLIYHILYLLHKEHPDTVRFYYVTWSKRVISRITMLEAEQTLSILQEQIQIQQQEQEQEQEQIQNMSRVAGKKLYDLAETGLHITDPGILVLAKMYMPPDTVFFISIKSLPDVDVLSVLSAIDRLQTRQLNLDLYQQLLAVDDIHRFIDTLYTVLLLTDSK